MTIVKQIKEVRMTSIPTPLFSNAEPIVTDASEVVELDARLSTEATGTDTIYSQEFTKNSVFGIGAGSFYEKYGSEFDFLMDWDNVSSSSGIMTMKNSADTNKREAFYIKPLSPNYKAWDTRNQRWETKFNLHDYPDAYKTWLEFYFWMNEEPESFDDIILSSGCDSWIIYFNPDSYSFTWDVPDFFDDFTDISTWYEDDDYNNGIFGQNLSPLSLFVQPDNNGSVFVGGSLYYEYIVKKLLVSDLDLSACTKIVFQAKVEVIDETESENLTPRMNIAFKFYEFQDGSGGYQLTSNIDITSLTFEQKTIPLSTPISFTVRRIDIISNSYDRYTMNYTKVLLHVDGGNGDTVTKDEAYARNGISFAAGATLSTADKKFGTSSLHVDGVGYLYASDNSEFVIGTNDFTIDFWVKFTAYPPFYSYLFTHHTGDTGAWRFNYYNTPDEEELTFLYRYDTYTGVISCYWKPDLDTWYHLAITRSSGWMRIFVNGVMQKEEEHPESIYDTANSMRIGRYLTGYMDEVRFCNGVARWTEDFTPPTSPYDLPDVKCSIDDVVICSESTSSKKLQIGYRSSNAVLLIDESDVDSNGEDIIYDQDYILNIYGIGDLNLEKLDECRVMTYLYRDGDDSDVPIFDKYNFSNLSITPSMKGGFANVIRRSNGTVQASVDIDYIKIYGQIDNVLDVEERGLLYDFGDGETYGLTNSKEVNHKYMGDINESEIDAITKLDIINIYNCPSTRANDGTDVSDLDIEIENAPPIAILSCEEIVVKDSDTTLVGSLSYDPEEDELLYKFQVVGEAPASYQTASTLTRTFTTVGTYTVELTVQEKNGGEQESTTVSRTIIVKNGSGNYVTLELMSPFEDIKASRTTSGTSVTELPEVNYSFVQSTKSGARVFSLTGQHYDIDSMEAHDPTTALQNIISEHEFVDMLYREGKIIEVEIPNFEGEGSNDSVIGKITAYECTFNYSDQLSIPYTITVTEINEEQLG